MAFLFTIINHLYENSQKLIVIIENDSIISANNKYFFIYNIKNRPSETVFLKK